MIAPRNFDKWNPALRGAFTKGYAAGISGESLSACPYKDKRTRGGQLTWSRAFIKAWGDGWERGDDQRRTDAITAYYNNKSTAGQPPPIPR